MFWLVIILFFCGRNRFKKSFRSSMWINVHLKEPIWRVDSFMNKSSLLYCVFLDDFRSDPTTGNTFTGSNLDNIFLLWSKLPVLINASPFCWLVTPVSCFLLPLAHADWISLFPDYLFIYLSPIFPACCGQRLRSGQEPLMSFQPSQNSDMNQRSSRR